MCQGFTSKSANLNLDGRGCGLLHARLPPGSHQIAAVIDLVIQVIGASGIAAKAA
jgi:hypothetical protein